MSTLDVPQWWVMFVVLIDFNPSMLTHRVKASHSSTVGVQPLSCRSLFWHHGSWVTAEKTAPPDAPHFWAVCGELSN